MDPKCYDSKLQSYQQQIESLKSKISSSNNTSTSDETGNPVAIHQNAEVCATIKELLADRANQLATLAIDEDNYCIRQAALAAEIAILSLIVDACCIAEVACDLLQLLQKERALRLVLLDTNSDNFCRTQAILSAEIALISLLIGLLCCLL